MRRATALAVPVRRLSWSICSQFIAIRPWGVHHNQKSQNNTKILYFRDWRSFKVIDANSIN